MLKASGCNKVFSIKTTNKRSILKAGLMTEKKCVWDRNLVVFNSGPVLLSGGLKSRVLLYIVRLVTYCATATLRKGKKWTSLL